MPHHSVLIYNSEHLDPNEKRLSFSLNIDTNISMHTIDRYETRSSTLYPTRPVGSLRTGAVTGPNHNYSSVFITRQREGLVAGYKTWNLVAIAGVHMKDRTWSRESVNLLKLLMPDPRGQYG